MSAWRFNEILAVLLPDRVLVSAPLGADYDATVVGFEQSIGIDDHGPRGWPAAVAALGSALARHARRKPKVTVLLSHQFIRAGLSRPRVGVRGRAEQEALARHDLAQRVGECGDAWTVRVGSVGASEVRVVTAVEHALVAALGETVTAAGAQLRSLQPWFTWIHDWVYPAQLALRDTWLVFHEPGYARVVQVADDEWTGLSGYPLRADESVAVALTRAELAAHAPLPERAVLLFSDEQSAEQPLREAGWNVTLFPMHWTHARTHCPVETGPTACRSALMPTMPLSSDVDVRINPHLHESKT